MLPLIPSPLSEPKQPLNTTTLDAQPKIRHGYRTVFINSKTCMKKKISRISLPIMVTALSFSVAGMTGCATLQALEPTAVLISDVKQIVN